MKRLFFSLCLFSVGLLCQAQKIINDPNAEVRTVGTFTGVSVSGGIDLYLSYGNEAVVVSASKAEFRDHIRTEVEQGVLKIWYDSKWGINISGTKNLKAYVSYKTLKSLEASGGSDINVDGSIAADELSLRISGGSDFRGMINVSKLNVDQSGGSNVRISGKATTVRVDASGGSDFKGYDLVSEVCNLEASGASDVEITVNREVMARASGASDIHYKGNPSVKEAKATGASSVKSRS